MLRIFKDQLGNTIEVSFPPQRIISLVPSQTELLFDLGLDLEIAGITRFCIHPQEMCKGKVKVGGTKKLEMGKFSAINPDLIIANKEENTKEEIEELQKKYPVWVSDINDLSSALDMIHTVGKMTSRAKEAQALADKIKRSFESFSPNANSTVAYFIWRRPYMAAASDTFINKMIEYAGYKNVFKDKVRYPVISKEDLTSAQPDLIFLSSEPYPFSEKHLEEFQELCPNSKVLLVDGEYFSWYGSRLLGTVEYFKALSERLKALS